MNLKLKIFILLVSSSSIVFVVNMLKKEKINIKYSLLWILTSVIVGIFGIFPHMIDRLSKWLGIYEPINALFFLGFIFVLLMIFSFIVTLSRISERQKNLAQHIAIKEYKERFKDGS